MLKFGLIGTNWITESFNEALNGSGKGVAHAIYSRTEEKATQFAQRNEIPLTYTSLEEMVNNADIDAVYIASPNSFHAEHAIFCMNHGKHVICEKPIASNEKEFTAMKQAANEAQVVLMEAMKSTLQPNFIAIIENIHKVGKIRRVFMSYCQYSSRYEPFKEGKPVNTFNPQFSNGSLMDIGVYCIYPLAVLFGKPRAIVGQATMLSSGIDGAGSVLLKYDGFEAVIMHSKISNSFLPAEIQGEAGTMCINKVNDPTHIEIRYNDGSKEDISRPQTKNSMQYEVEEFISLIEQGKMQSNINSHENSNIVMKITDEVRMQIGLEFPADQK